MEQRGDRDKKGTGNGDADDDPLRDLLAALRQSPAAPFRAAFGGELIASAIGQLSSPGSRDEFEALCGMGCHRGILAALVSLLRYREQLEDWWGVVIGPPEKRDNVCQALLDAAAALDRTFAPILDDETATFGLTGIGRIPPGRLSSELRLYSRMLRLGALLGEEMGVRSLEHFSRCLLTIYIERATGRNNHASLAVIIADVCNRPDYAEDAQKQWRFRCKVLIDSPPSVLAGVSTLLQDLTAAFAVGGESPLATQ